MSKFLLFIVFYFPFVNCREENNTKLNENEYEIETIKIVLSNDLPPPTRWDEEKIKSFGNHKALLGYLNAYFDHCPIIVSPNVIWQLILNYFSDYVNTNSEFLRAKFVDFKEKKNLIITRYDTIDDIYKYEDDIIEELNDKISEYIGDELINILTPNFSTSTKQTIIAGKVSIMSTLKNYFNYGVYMLCGIPYILLEGTLEDWEKILQKINFLSKYELGEEFEEELGEEFKILKMLKPFEKLSGKSTKKLELDKMKKNIEEIINTKKGNINLEFWRKIIMETRVTMFQKKGCMLRKVEKNLISGWICDFYPTMEVNKDKNSNDLPEEILEVPIIVKQADTKETKKFKIYTGIMDIKQDHETYIVEPIVSYNFSKPFDIDPNNPDDLFLEDL